MDILTKQLKPSLNGMNSLLKDKYVKEIFFGSVKFGDFKKKLKWIECRACVSYGFFAFLEKMLMRKVCLSKRLIT